MGNISQDLDLCLKYKASSGYLLNFVLNIADKNRQDMKKLIVMEIFQRRSMSRNLRQGSYGSWKTWKVMEFKYYIFQAWKVMQFN